MSNKQAGTNFEKEFCKLAAENGFWAHLLQQNKDGQPADVIIAKNGVVALVDCKDCEKNTFPFLRIKENQECAMRKWIQKGNELAVFALKVTDGVRILNYVALMGWKLSGIKQLNLEAIMKYSKPFEEWGELHFANNNK